MSNGAKNRRPGPASETRESGARRKTPQLIPASEEVEIGPGAVLGGKYRLEELIAEGGMGTVWRGHHMVLDTPIAVKMIREDSASRDDDLHLRLAREAQAAAKLGHPAIVRVLDFGYATEEVPYLVMELVEGESLEDVLDRRGKPIDPITALRTLLPIVDALATAHEEGIVHRDMKPSNVLLTKRGSTLHPKLIDFGVAKSEVHRMERITAVGSTVGSPAFMAPEQIQGEETGAAADIWSLCVVLFQMLSLRMPFAGDTPYTLYKSIIEEDPPDLYLDEGLDEELWTIILRGLVKRPTGRWSSMRKLGRAMAEWLRAQGVTDDVTGVSLRTAWGDPSETPQPFASMPPGPDSETDVRRVSSSGFAEVMPTSNAPRASSPPEELSVDQVTELTGKAEDAFRRGALDEAVDHVEALMDRRPWAYEGAVRLAFELGTDVLDEILTARVSPTTQRIRIRAPHSGDPSDSDVDAGALAGAIDGLTIDETLAVFAMPRVRTLYLIVSLARDHRIALEA